MCAYPNAGLPNVLPGCYDETPEQTSATLREFAIAGLVNVVGGCCGTTPDHIAAIADAVAGLPSCRPAEGRRTLQLSGLEAFELNDEIRSSTSASARTSPALPSSGVLVTNGEYAAALDVARDQVENGAQVIDVNMDEGLLDCAT